MSSNDIKYDLILSAVQQLDDKTLILLLSSLKPTARLVIRKSKDCKSGETVSSLKLNGFVNIEESPDQIIAQKPHYEIGSAVKLNLNDNEKPTTTKKIWSLAADDIVDDSVDLIDDDSLLTEEDKAKPDPQSLRVCGTTKQRKACADCSCGLAEELENEAIEQIKKNTQNTKSSCGNVCQPIYLPLLPFANYILFSVIWGTPFVAPNVRTWVCLLLSLEKRWFSTIPVISNSEDMVLIDF